MTTDFSTTLVVEQTPEEAFNAINHVRGWWSEALEGDSQKLGDEFIYRHKDVHYSKQKLIELIPNSKVIWLITDSYLSFTKKPDEWTGTHVHFDISTQGGKTHIRFTHQGLNPDVECFGACSNGWNYYLHNSLLPLITTGTGQPDQKENMTKAKNETVV